MRLKMMKNYLLRSGAFLTNFAFFIGSFQSHASYHSEVAAATGGLREPEERTALAGESPLREGDLNYFSPRYFRKGTVTTQDLVGKFTVIDDETYSFQINPESGEIYLNPRTAGVAPVYFEKIHDQAQSLGALKIYNQKGQVIAFLTDHRSATDASGAKRYGVQALKGRIGLNGNNMTQWYNWSNMESDWRNWRNW